MAVSIWYVQDRFGLGGPPRIFYNEWKNRFNNILAGWLDYVWQNLYFSRLVVLWLVKFVLWLVKVGPARGGALFCWVLAWAPGLGPGSS